MERENEINESLNGHLLPGNAPMPPLNSSCHDYTMEKDDYLMIENTNMEIINVFPHDVLTVRGEKIITVSKSEDGTMVLTMSARNSDGTLVARFDSDGFEVSPILFKRHPDKSTLIVEDQSGNKMIKVQYLNKKTITLRGYLVIDGQRVNIPNAGRMQLEDGCSIHSNALVKYGS